MPSWHAGRQQFSPPNAIPPNIATPDQPPPNMALPDTLPPIWRGWVAWLLIFLAGAGVMMVLSGCDQASVRVSTPMPLQQTPSAARASTLSPPEDISSPPQPWDSGWIETEPGVAIRHKRWQVLGSVDDYAPVYMVRLDPTLVLFHVAYNPDSPYTISKLCDDPQVIAVLNGGFFDNTYRATALVISGGQMSGNSYQRQGGMFAVDAAGNVSLRYLGEVPYRPEEQLVEALQSWPMLIKQGGIATYFSTTDTKRARRSVLAIDRTGHILFLAFPTSDLTLEELAPWLVQSDLEIDAALNLDGGSSTGLCVQSGEQHEQIDAFSPIPLVLMATRNQAP